MKSCLVVDDSSVIRKVARRILEDLSFTITEAEDGQQALERCQAEMPDAILLDWNMPVMDGLEFLAQRVGDRPDRGLRGTVGAGAAEPGVQAVRDHRRRRKSLGA